MICLAPSAPAPVDQTECGQKRLTLLGFFSKARGSVFALPRFHHDSLTGVPSWKAHVEPIEQSFVEGGRGWAGISSVPEHASRMLGNSLPCWSVSDLVRLNAWRSHVPNLCQTANNIDMHNLVALHMPHDSVVGTCTPNKQRSLPII